MAIFFFISANVVSCEQPAASTEKNDQVVLDTDVLRIEKLTNGTYRHISYLDTDSYGKVACNGLIVHDRGEVVIIDTPTNNEAAEELIAFVEAQLKSQVKVVVPSHFHVDCLGSLEIFHEHGIQSVGYWQTKKLAEENGSELQLTVFATDTLIKVGNEEVEIYYPGEGHTKDNVVAYFARDSVLFGGCLVKTMGARKGNLADANVQMWSSSANSLFIKFPNLRVVVPGHGDPGGRKLLDYTIDLFSTPPILLDEDGDSIAVEDHPGIDGKVIFEVVANDSRGYVYQLVEYKNAYSSVLILKNGRPEFEFIASGRKDKIDLEEINMRRAEWTATCNKHNAKDLVEELYSEDAIYYNHKPLVVGHKAITKDYDYMNRPEYNLELDPLVIHAVGKDLVFEIGQCHGSYNGKYILAWTKEEDGKWRVFMDSNI